MGALQNQPLLEYENEEKEEFSEETKIIRAVNRALHGAAHLNNLLPTGTMLAFQVLCPIVSNNGFCNSLHRCLTGALLGFCSLWAFLLSFTDSIKAPDGKVYYGVASVHGLWIFGRRSSARIDTSLLRIKLIDFFHGFLSVLVVASLGFSNFDVVDCFYPEFPRVYMNTVPVIAGFLISILFVMFPTARKGIGHPLLLTCDANLSIY